MGMFASKRDARFMASINKEVVNQIIDTEIEFYKLVVEESDSNLYGESDKKSFYQSILIPAMINKQGKTANQDDYGHTYTRTLEFGLLRDTLVKSGFYPEVGDIAFWDNEYYELDNVDENQYVGGKNPFTWPNGDSHGYSVSVICEAHVTRQTPQNITDIRFGGSNNEDSYKGF